MERVRERQAYAGVSRVTFVPVKPSLTSAASGSRLEGCSPDISPCLSSLALSASWTQDPVSLDLPSQGLSVTLIYRVEAGGLNKSSRTARCFPVALTATHSRGEDSKVG